MVKSIKAFIAFSFLLLTFSSVYSQDIQRGVGEPGECGEIVEGEFIANAQENTYKITLNAGDSLNISIVPVGGQLRTQMFLTGPTNLGVVASSGNIDESNWFNGRNQLEQVPKFDTGVLSAGGTYTLRILNFTFWRYEYSSDTYSTVYNLGGVGVYTLNVGCNLRDGTVIIPGDSDLSTTSNNGTSMTISAPAFSGVGFPGLAPVDFSNVAEVPVSVGVGAVTPTGGEILGFTLDANAGDTLALSFTRLSGNLNLGLVVLSADNKVVFQASLVTSSELTTRFTLPSAGQYTIGVFRIDLLPPSTPEATAFQVTATLNP